MGTYNTAETGLQCPRCGHDAEKVEVELFFGDTSHMTTIEIGGLYPFYSRKSEKNGGLPSADWIVGGGYAVCGTCGRDFFCDALVERRPASTSLVTYLPLLALVPSTVIVPYSADHEEPSTPCRICGASETRCRTFLGAVQKEQLLCDADGCRGTSIRTLAVPPRIHVASRRAVLDGEVDVGAYGAVISIQDMGIEAPPAVQEHPNALILHFDDIFRDLWKPGQGHPPEPHHVQRIMDFARQHPDARMLIHCQAGVSRSGAAACIVQAVRVADAGERLRPSHVDALIFCFDLFPNDLMLQWADELLGCRPGLTQTVGPVVQQARGWWSD